jgi:hypothetical protein
MTSQPPSDAELAGIAGLAARATPGPWHVRHLDDDHAMSLVAVSTAVPRLLAEITRLRNLLDNPPNHKS